MGKKQIDYEQYSAQKDEEFLKDFLKKTFKHYEKNQNINVLLKRLGQAARIKGVAQIADESNISREYIYHMLSAQGNPSFVNLEAVINALGYDIQFKKIK